MKVQDISITVCEDVEKKLATRADEAVLAMESTIKGIWANVEAKVLSRLGIYGGDVDAVVTWSSYTSSATLTYTLRDVRITPAVFKRCDLQVQVGLKARDTDESPPVNGTYLPAYISADYRYKHYEGGNNGCEAFFLSASLPFGDEEYVERVWSNDLSFQGLNLQWRF